MANQIIKGVVRYEQRSFERDGEKIGYDELSILTEDGEAITIPSRAVRLDVGATVEVEVRQVGFGKPRAVIRKLSARRS